MRPGLGMLMLVASAAAATTPSLDARALQQAAAVTLGYDTLAQRCETRGGGFKPEDARRVAQWQREHGIDRVRAHLQSLASRSPVERERVQRLQAQIKDQFAVIPDTKSCQAAVSATQQPMAQLATQTPQLLATLGNANAPDVPTKAPAAPSPASKAAAIGGPADANAAQVQGFAFDTCMRMGVGGALWATPCPIVLLRDGSALKKIENLADPAGLQANRRSQPQHWTQWRRSAGELQRQNSKGQWSNLPYQVLYEKLPADFRLEGRYRSLGGAGNTAIGGTSSVAAWQHYEFSRDGRVTRSGGVGSRSEAGGSSTVTASNSPERTGRYRIDGLVLAIQYDDGSSERRMIVADPKDPKTAIWLDGTGYSRR